MKIVVDKQIPFIGDAVERMADTVVYVPGKDICAETVADADALIVRTRTRCNRRLLEGSRVKFIATATIGFDHIDTDYCRKAGIAWANAPGCNASSVEQYMLSALLLWQQHTEKPLKGQTIGIVGAGHVGSRIANIARELGMQTMINDLPLQDQGHDYHFATLEQLEEACDIISFHVPLNRDGQYKTFHLANETFFRNLRRKPLLINTSRGEVVDTAALLHALDCGSVSAAIIDTWENEPCICLDLLSKTFIGTPHIAGYSADGKANATRMALDALGRFFQLETACHIAPPPPPHPLIKARDWTDAVLQIYNPQHDSLALKQCPEAFEQLRDNYPLRRERTAYTVVKAD